jgi:HlyD family secretion protein
MNKTNKISVFGPIMLGFFTILVLLGGIAYWALMSQIAGAIIASGRIEVEQNRQIVQHTTGGVVDAVDVREGNTVRVGDILIRLDTQELLSKLSLIEGQYYEVLAQLGYVRAVYTEADEISFEEELRLESERTVAVQELIAGQEMLWQALRKSVASEVAKTKLPHKLQVLTR